MEHPDHSGGITRTTTTKEEDDEEDQWEECPLPHVNVQTQRVDDADEEEEEEEQDEEEAWDLDDSLAGCAKLYN
jgi:hypothetical protein